MKWRTKFLMFVCAGFLLTSCSHQDSAYEIEYKSHSNKDSKLEEKNMDDDSFRKEPIHLEVKEITNTVVNEITGENNFEHYIDHDDYDRKYGIFTFRGNNFRNKTSIGSLDKTPTELKEDWIVSTDSHPEWGGGSGWTGQPLMVRWDASRLNILRVDQKYKEKDFLNEIIQVSLDGKVYFIELETGESTREPFDLGKPIKGTPSLDPRSWPMLIVGEGIPSDEDDINLQFINLRTDEIDLSIPGIDDFAYRRWGAFDGSALYSPTTDTVVTNGENGLIYKIKLNTNFDMENGIFNVNPQVVKMRYKNDGEIPGAESSIVGIGKYVFVADNNGLIQAIDTDTMKTLWATDSYDDTDATMILNIEDDDYFLYTSSEIDKQGESGLAKIRKINAVNGEIVWEKDYEGYSIVDKEKPINGGFLSSPLLGEGKNKGQIIFTMAKKNNQVDGMIFSLDLETGKEIWSTPLEHYSWSSPVGITDKDNNFYILQADSAGNLILFDGDGEEITRTNLGYNIESTPIIVNDRIVVGTRGGQIHSLIIQ